MLTGFGSLLVLKIARGSAISFATYSWLKLMIFR